LKLTDGFWKILMVRIIILNIPQKKGRVTIAHPRKDTPIKTAKSILKKAGLEGKK